MTNRRQFLAGVSQSAIAAAFGQGVLPTRRAQAQAPERERPSFIFILADDLGWADLTCYGHPFYETPNIDRLMAAGMRFTDAYAAAPVCSPTRASIMTGKYPARLGLTEWIPGKRPSPRERVIAPKYLREMPLSEVTIAEALRAAGYATGHVGKWHMGGAGYLPEDQGFDVNVAGTHAGSPAGGYFLPNRMKLPGAARGDYLTDRLTAEGITFIEAHAGRPFFLYQSYHSVHTPIQSKAEYEEKYQRKAAQLEVRINPKYAGMIQSLDEGVGRIISTLDRLGIAERTVVVFMSDNGGLSGVTSNAPLRAGKGHVYEGGIREPMAIKAPGLTRSDSICRVPVSSIDFYPTIMELAGVRPPAAHVPDGVSIVPLLAGRQQPSRRALFWHYPHYSPQGGRPAGAVRVGPHKLLEFYDDGGLELYDLSQDIGEVENLVDALPGRTAELQSLLRVWRGQVGARMPTPNPDYDPNATRRGSPEEQREKPLAKGSRDAEFAVLDACAVDAAALGYAVRAGATPGVALKKLQTPLKSSARFRLRLKSLQMDTSERAWRNGFLAFGDGAAPERLIHCGLYLGGRRKYALVEGPVNASRCRLEVDLTLDPYTEFGLDVSADLPGKVVTMTVNGESFTLALSRQLRAITHVGYAVINTTTGFTPVDVTGE